MIDIGIENGEESAYVHLSSGQRVLYAALSYCWGGPQPITLTKLTKRDMLRGIATSTLPQTIQDAITVTRKVGLRYLWVDALCIIQDSDSDRNAEITVMDRIYQNAQVTISAASAGRCQDGFLATRSWRGDWSPSTSFVSIPYACPNGKRGNVQLYMSRSYKKDSEPLSRRGWALQERMLSSRVLVYGTWQLYWECQRRKKWAGGRAGYFLSCLSELSSAENLQFEDESCEGNVSEEIEDTPWTNWTDVVYEYSQKVLTESSDKLPALSGIASKYQKDTKDIYCAGLWKESLLKGLKWKTEPADHRPSIYLAPTWSWASVLDSTWWADYKPPAKNSAAASTAIIDCHVTLEDPLAPLGKVSEGSLTIRGVSRALQWDGDFMIPRRDLEHTWVPPPERGVGSPLWPDGVVARVEADVTREIVDIEDESGDGTVWEVGFFMGHLVPDSERVRRPVVFVILDGDSALVLAEQLLDDDGAFARLGLVQFKDEETLERYFEGCEEETFVIQ